MLTDLSGGDSAEHFIPVKKCRAWSYLNIIPPIEF